MIWRCECLFGGDALLCCALLHAHSGMSAIARWVFAACLLLCLGIAVPWKPNVFVLASRAIALCVSPQFSALDVLAGMMMKRAAKCDKHAE